jgi:P-type Mg2+ transporter
VDEPRQSPLTITTLSVAAAAALIPYTPVAELLAFAPLPPSFLAFVLGATLTYLLLVEIIKRAVFRPHQVKC